MRKIVISFHLVNLPKFIQFGGYGLPNTHTKMESFKMFQTTPERVAQAIWGM